MQFALARPVARAPHADLGDQVLEPFAVGGGAGTAEIRIDDDDTLNGPAQRHGALAQGVLAPRALGVLEHLAQRGLTHVQIRVATQVIGAHLMLAGAHTGAAGM